MFEGGINLNALTCAIFFDCSWHTGVFVPCIRV